MPLAGSSTVQTVTMTVRVEVNPSVLDWAVKRSRVDPAELAAKFPIHRWAAGDEPTLRQLESFARATRTAIGLLLLDEPPVDTLPIPDFRTVATGFIGSPSPDLLETIEICEQRQDWYRDYLIETGNDPLEFIASATVNTPVARVASERRELLGFTVDGRGTTWSQALATLIDQAEDAGVLVMVSGVVGSNAHRVLDPAEFRGFALPDEYAPLVFINGTDTKAAQIFTLAHELAHLWLGTGGVDDADLAVQTTNDIERWCNAVAAEFLVPLEVIAAAYDAEASDLIAEVERLARIFKVSTLVILRRILDARLMAWTAYRDAYRSELDRVLALAGTTRSGGNYYNTQPRRVSRPFARAILSSTLSGRTTYHETYQLMGFRNPATLHEMADRLGVA